MDDKEKDEKLDYVPEKKIILTFNLGYYTLFNFAIDYIWYGNVYDHDFPPPTYAETLVNIGNFSLFNLTLSITPFHFVLGDSYLKTFKIIFKAENLTNEKYEMVKNYFLPGRNYQIGASYTYEF